MPCLMFGSGDLHGITLATHFQPPSENILRVSISPHGCSLVGGSFIRCCDTALPKENSVSPEDTTAQKMRLGYCELENRKQEKTGIISQRWKLKHHQYMFICVDSVLHFLTLENTCQLISTYQLLWPQTSILTFLHSWRTLTWLFLNYECYACILSKNPEPARGHRPATRLGEWIDVISTWLSVGTS